MASFASADEWTPFMQQIEDAGSALLQPYDTLDQLLNRVSHLDPLLKRVEQQPSPAMERALKTPIEALATDGLLKNVDLNIKILVGSCICEIARITAPEPPYEENKMRDISDLLVTIIKSLSFVTGNAYRKASLVLALVSRCHLFNAMWDCDEAFIIEMFLEFLHLRINHPDNVISEMEQIMTMILNEEAPSELFVALMDSLRRDNENLYPVSYNLAERVFNSCADMLKRRLPIEVRLSEIIPHDYSEVVARVLNVGNKLILQDDTTKEVGQSAALQPEPLKNDEAPPARKDDTRKSEILGETSQVEFIQLNHPCHTALHAQKNKESFGDLSSSEMIEDSAQTPDIAAGESVPEEFNGPVVVDTRNANSNEESMKNNSPTILLHACDKAKGPNVYANCPQVKDSDAKTIVLEESNAEVGSPNIEDKECDVETSLQQPTNLEKVSTPRKRGWKPNFLLKLGEGYDDLWVDSGKRSSDGAPRRRNYRKDIKGPHVSVSKDSLVESERFPNRKRSRKGKPRSAYHAFMEDENLGSPSSRMGSNKQRKGEVKHSGEKYLSKVFAKDDGKALVGSKIRVYWPRDNKFYKGSIISFDIETKRYKVIYDDGDEEVLDLAREQFELLANESGTDRVQISDDDTLTLHDLLQNALTSRPSTKKRKLASHVLIENVSTFNGGRLEVGNSRSNLQQDQPIAVVNPAVLDLPGQKSRNLKQGEVQTEPTPSFSLQTSGGFCQSGNPRQHQVKSSSSILIRDAIFKRYGDITANCIYKSQSMRESLLEVVCNVVGRLKNSVVTTSDMKAMTLEISDAADAKLNVSWLQQFLMDMFHEKEAAKPASGTRRTAILTIGAAKKEVERRQIELESAKMKLRDAKRRVKALKCVLEKIDSDILESVGQEKSWRKRLDELLTSQG